MKVVLEQVVQNVLDGGGVSVNQEEQFEPNVVSCLEVIDGQKLFVDGAGGPITPTCLLPPH